MKRTPPLLGLMLGDAAGIGPEICARVLADRRLAQTARLLVFGDARTVELGARQAEIRVALKPSAAPEEVDWQRPETPLIDLANLDSREIQPGQPSARSGRAAGETLAHMVRLALEGRLEGIVFAPLHKRALHEGGWRFPDEHQLFAHLCGHRGPFGEMNVLDNLWMSRVTSHVSLRKALEQITAGRIVEVLELADRTMRAAGIDAPRIGVAALNPHAGEGGLFGDEEIQIIAPAVAKAACQGIRCAGPLPADTIFLKAFAGEYDGVLSMYHDQGQIATKLKGFDRGVTVTAGLQIPFATPAHGTAVDIVGKRVASTGALEQAVRLCARLANDRRHP